MFVRLFQKLALRARSGISILLTLESQGEQIILEALREIVNSFLVKRESESK